MMAYNITAWRTEEMEEFLIPLSAFYAYSGAKVELSDNDVQVSGWPALLTIEGTIKGDYIAVFKLRFAGEGSGSSWDDFNLVLSKSKGRLVSTQVWAGGDRATRLTVVDGVITEEEIEL